jgi:homocysteine S-methyltransferase
MASKGVEFIERLRERPAAGDGANGTRLYELGCDISRGSESLNLTHPDLVRRVHAEYVEAGAELVETNTFAADSLHLEAFGLADRRRDVILAGVKLAREAAGRRAAVSGSAGPLPVRPTDDAWDEGLARRTYRDLFQTLLEGGVDLVHLETFADLDVLLLALEEARALAGADVPVIAQMRFGGAGYAPSGQDAREVAARLVAAGADVVGANCGRGVSVITAAVKGLLAGAGDVPVAVYPNAGFPESVGGRLVYMATPAYLADHAVRWARMGAKLIGGCCGTTPESIRAVAMALTTLRKPGPRVAVAPPPEESPPPHEAGAAKAGGFLDAIGTKPLPVIAELDPPAHLAFQPVVDGARLLAAAGADAISLAENPLASVRLSNITVAARIRREVGIQTIIHVTCRDRNLLGLQSALMGAAVEGIEGVLCVTGDPVPAHGGPGRSVFDLHAPGLVRLAAGLNRGVLATGADIRGQANFSLGVAFNSAAGNLEGELARLKRKTAEGARFIMTQPVFDADHGRHVLDLLRPTGLRVFLGLFPLVSARSALYLHNEVPGVSVPQDVLDRLTSLPEKADQEAAGVEMAQRLLADLLPAMDGVYLVSPFNRASIVEPMVRQACAARAERGQGV